MCNCIPSFHGIHHPACGILQPLATHIVGTLDSDATYSTGEEMYSQWADKDLAERHAAWEDEIAALMQSDDYPFADELAIAS